MGPFRFVSTPAAAGHEFQEKGWNGVTDIGTADRNNSDTLPIFRFPMSFLFLHEHRFYRIHGHWTLPVTEVEKAGSESLIDRGGNGRRPVERAAGKEAFEPMSN